MAKIKAVPKKAARQPNQSRPVARTPRGAAAVTISVWELDPANGNQPDGGKLMQVSAPDLSATTLQTSISGFPKPPSAQVYAPGSAGFRYWNTAAALARASAFWSTQVKGIKWQGQVGNVLPVNLDAGSNLNAFYNRNNLSFFHGTTAGRTIFTADSPDIVCHEHGHAVLDALKPQIWHAAGIEADAFHESFGDVSNILCALQLQSVRIGLIAETQGAIYSSSRVSRLAEQLGWAIRQGRPNEVDPDCLRNAVNPFFYRNPNTLPTSAPANNLSSQSHSFSRVFTAAFFEGLAGMYRLHKVTDEQVLLQIANAMGNILVAGIKNAVVVPSFFSEVASQMVYSAQMLFPSIGYHQALQKAFVKHGILAATAMASFNAMGPQQRRNGRGAGFAATQPNSTVTGDTELPLAKMSVGEYGLGLDTIEVHMAVEQRQFGITGAALAIGALDQPSAEESAKAFFEQLMRTGRLKYAPGSRKLKAHALTAGADDDDYDLYTHELVADGNSFVLRRLRTACMFH